MRPSSIMFVRPLAVGEIMSQWLYRPTAVCFVGCLCGCRAALVCELIVY